LAPGPGEPVPSVPPVGQAEFWKGVQGDISSWSQAEGREGEAGSEATVGRGLIVPSKSSGPPSAKGGFWAASCTHHIIIEDASGFREFQIYGRKVEIQVLRGIIESRFEVKQ